MGHGDNRETLAQAMYGKSEDDMTEDELNELKRIIQGEAPTEEQEAQEAAEKEKQVPSEDNRDTAENLEEKLQTQIIYRPPHTDTPIDEPAPADISIDDVGSKEYMSTGRTEAVEGDAQPAETEQKA